MTSGNSGTVVDLKAGSYDLFYVEANGLPEVLETEFLGSATAAAQLPVPEPRPLTLVATGLIGMRFVRGLRKKA